MLEPFVYELGMLVQIVIVILVHQLEGLWLEVGGSRLAAGAGHPRCTEPSWPGKWQAKPESEDKLEIRVDGWLRYRRKWDSYQSIIKPSIALAGRKIRL